MRNVPRLSMQADFPNALAGISLDREITRRKGFAQTAEVASMIHDVEALTTHLLESDDLLW